MLNNTDLLCDLIRIKSVTDNIPEVNRCVSFLRDKLEAEGLHCAVETFDRGRQALWASNIEGKKPDLMIVVHLDVVPVDSDSQFEPIVDGDIVTGRGSEDCKGNAVAAIAALQEIAADKASGASIGILFTADEEKGGITTAGMVSRGYGAAKAALVYDAGGGANIYIGQKGIVIIRVTAEGKGGHASRPWSFDNPIYKLMDGLAKLRAYWDTKYPHVQGKDWHNSMAPCMLSSGKASNQIPDTATATINIRFIEDASPEKIADEIREVTGLKVEMGETSPCVFFPPDSPAVDVLSKVIAESFGVEKTGHLRMNGATDARHLAGLGVPVAVAGVKGEGAHQSDERVWLSSIKQYGAIAAEFARRLAKM